MSGASPDLFREREHRHLDDAALERLWSRTSLSPPQSQNLFGLFNPGAQRHLARCLSLSLSLSLSLCVCVFLSLSLLFACQCEALVGNCAVPVPLMIIESDLINVDTLQTGPPPPFAEVFGARFVVTCDRLTLDLNVPEAANRNVSD